MSATTFDTTVQLRGQHGDPTRSHAALDPAWSSLRGIHGGYVNALIVAAAERALDGRPVRTIATNFLRPGAIGEMELVVEPVRSGRSVSVLAVTACQHGREIAASGVTAAVAPAGGASWTTPVDLGLPEIGECVANNPPPGVRHFEHGVLRIDPADVPFGHGPRARIAGYVRPAQQRPIDARWLAMAMDWFPPSAFSKVDPPTGGVSVDYSVHIHRTLDSLEPDEWLTGEFRADESLDGLALETGILVDPQGNVLAQSFHTRFTG